MTQLAVESHFRKKQVFEEFFHMYISKTKQARLYLFIGPLRGQYFVHALHLIWVPTFLVDFLLLPNSRVRMYVRCTVKTPKGGNGEKTNNLPNLRQLEFLMGSHHGASLIRLIVRRLPRPCPLPMRCPPPPPPRCRRAVGELPLPPSPRFLPRCWR